ncbi:hypothetical protein LSTR_LSTR007481 [Laodelphax striatellus]|uniref:Metallo-beta-lactamase domain-containing protein n=1 Tax=Laodelphax striatellus TaxID=195883 RepID=A0A482X507_LAOST|nr:hypothetical protein LSTR_LSTR007481 [Laodelphax striatellus]
MSTFNGRLENPQLHFIAIDDFSVNNHDASVFFVSHAHSDHLTDFRYYGATLFSSNSRKTLYCTHITKRLLQIQYNNISDDNVVSLNVGESTILRAPQNSENELLVTVTLLPTLHVLGSVMFLFQCQGISALYTGDFRIHTGDVAKIKGLHDKDGNPLKITDLYLDTTFANTKHLWFPKRDCAVRKIIKLSEEWLDERETNLVALRIVSYYGYESLIIDLSKALKTKIVVEDSDFPHFKYIPEMDEFITFSDSISSDTFRGKRPRMDSNRLGRVHVCPDFRYNCNRCFDETRT